jgi:hypothetical protein
VASGTETSIETLGFEKRGHQARLSGNGRKGMHMGRRRGRGWWDHHDSGPDDETLDEDEDDDVTPVGY